MVVWQLGAAVQAACPGCLAGWAPVRPGQPLEPPWGPPQVATKAAQALGHICFGLLPEQQAAASAATGPEQAADAAVEGRLAAARQALVKRLLALSCHKAEEVQFALGEALAFGFGGVPVRPETVLGGDFSSLADSFAIFRGEAEAGEAQAMQVRGLAGWQQGGRVWVLRQQGDGRCCLAGGCASWQVAADADASSLPACPAGGQRTRSSSSSSGPRSGAGWRAGRGAAAGAGHGAG